MITDTPLETGLLTVPFIRTCTNTVSVCLPDETIHFFSPQSDDIRDVVVVTTRDSAERAEALMERLGYEDGEYLCYIGGMDRLPKDKLQFPKVIPFQVNKS